MQPTSVFWTEEFHGQRTLVGYSPWGHKQLDTTEQLSLYLFNNYKTVPSFIDFLTYIFYYFHINMKTKLDYSISFLLLRFRSVAQSRPTLCDPMDCSTPGLPVHHQLQSLLKLMSIESGMPSNHIILSSPSPPFFNLSQHQGLFK